MDPKLALLFMLIGTVIGLSHVSDGGFARIRRLAVARRRRGARFGFRRG